MDTWQIQTSWRRGGVVELIKSEVKQASASLYLELLNFRSSASNVVQSFHWIRRSKQWNHTPGLTPHRPLVEQPLGSPKPKRIVFHLPLYYKPVSHTAACGKFHNDKTTSTSVSVSSYLRIQMSQRQLFKEKWKLHTRTHTHERHTYENQQPNYLRIQQKNSVFQNCNNYFC